MRGATTFRWITIGLLSLAFWPVIRAETWRTVSGETFEARLSGVHGALVVFSDEKGSRQIVAEGLDDDAISRVADYVASRPSPPLWSQSQSPVASALRGKLQVVRKGKLVTFEPPQVPEPEIYVVYFGASWSGATRQFMPELVTHYETAMVAAAGKFEMIYVSRDRAASDHQAFALENAMPWVNVRYSDLGKIKLISRWAVTGVPSLVVLNGNGDVILDSETRTPTGHMQTPLDSWQRFTGLLVMMTGQSPAAKRAMHRLAIALYVRGKPTGMHGPQPYVLALDRSRYQTIEPNEIEATLEVDERGRIAQAEFAPRLGAVIEDQLTQDMRNWLFMPAVREGKATRFTVKLPIKF